MSFLSPIRLACAAFLISLFFSLVILPIISASYNVNPDPDRFGQLAANLSVGGGFAYSPGEEPVLERAPLYPLMLALLFKFAGGHSLAAVQVFQASLHALMVLLVCKLAARFHSPNRSLLIGALVAVHPMLLWYAGRIWIESLFTLLLLLIVFSFVNLLEKPMVSWGMISGAAIGLAALTKSVMLAFPVFMLPFLNVKLGRQGLRLWIASVLVIVLLVLPWTVRNYLVSGSFVPVHTSLGFNLMQGKVIGEEWPRGEFFILDYWRLAIAETDSILRESGLSWEDPEGDRKLIAYRFTAIGSPITYARDIFKNAVTYWYLSESQAKSIVVGLLQGFLLAAVMVSLYRSGKGGRRKVLPIMLVVFFMVAITASIVGWGRYSAPLIPLLLVLAFPVRSTGAAQ